MRRLTLLAVAALALMMSVRWLSVSGAGEGAAFAAPPTERAAAWSDQQAAPRVIEIAEPLVIHVE